VSKIAAGGWRSKSRDQIRSSGYVIHSLEAALWAVHGAGTFEEAVVTAVNLGDDADSVGAICGQLAGAIWGASAIPDRWMEKLAWGDKLEAASGALLDGVVIVGSRHTSCRKKRSVSTLGFRRP
jgi:ADP-ribosyl-[dinitrogen reductase] hydrolase